MLNAEIVKLFVREIKQVNGTDFDILFDDGGDPVMIKGNAGKSQLILPYGCSLSGSIIIIHKNCKLGRIRTDHTVRIRYRVNKDD